MSPCCYLEICIQLGISFLSSFAFHVSSLSLLIIAKNWEQVSALQLLNG